MTGDLPYDVKVLASPFFKSNGGLGQFTLSAAEGMPASYRTLLAHDDHMTVTHEAFFGSLVDVHVVEERQVADIYTRLSLLTLQSDGEVVQCGVMRIDLSQVGDDVCREVADKQAPLGRILIRNNVMRHVELISLFHIEVGAELAALLKVQAGSETYGRMARIHVRGRPAIELLEIVRLP